MIDRLVALALMAMPVSVGAQSYWDPIAPPVDPMHEVRYCGAPARNADGSIKRSTAVLNAYKKIHPCPVTGLSSGACPGWQINHIVPLAVGGCDAVSNLAWMPVQIKTCTSDWCVDRWERKYYARPHGILPPIPDE